MTGLILMAAGFAGTILLLGGCRKYEDVPPFFEQIDTTKKQGNRKVIFIGVDGVVGSLLKTMAPPVLTAMQQHSKYSYESLSDEVTTDAASWKTLLTGVSYSKHTVRDSSFGISGGGDSEDHDPVKQYVSLFTNLLSSEKSDMTTAVMSPWRDLVHRLTPEVENGYVAVNDEAVKDSALRLFKKVNTTHLTVVNFNSPALAGKMGGFEASNIEYKNAILKIDGYIGEILEAVKSRPGYNRDEEWLIIVGSSHGGEGSGYGGSLVDETNTFLFFYNERFLPTELTKEGTFSSQLITGSGATAVRAVLNDPNAYDLSMAPMTYQFKVKGSLNGSYPVFFSKKGPVNGNTIRSTDPGFSVIASGTGIQNFMRGTAAASPSTGIAVMNQAWHDVAFVYTDSSDRRLAKIYVDGDLNSSLDITGLGAWSTFKSPVPLTLGYRPGDYTSFTMANYTDIKVFNTALTQSDIRANLCTKSPLLNHTKKQNIIGYWPCNEAVGGAFKNLAPQGAGKDFILENAGNWTMQNIIPCNFPLSPGAGKLSLILSSVDIAPAMFYWLGVRVVNNWGWQGSATWLEQYETEFYQ